MKSRSTKIGVYAGTGTSHSWLWFVDLFEKAQLYDLVFLDEHAVRSHPIDALDVLVMSGGDTFAVAGALGRKGASAIERFVAGGGLYMGSCAGAYLPMKSSKKPLDRFNFADVKITNLTKILPDVKVQTCKFCTSYGCDFIFHPVRESVLLKTTSHWGPDRPFAFESPLYGGPGMEALDPSWVLAKYEQFTKKTRFLTTAELAAETLIGKGAVVRVPYKAGCFYLLGPHLEHPGYQQANQFILDAVSRELSALERLKTFDTAAPDCGRDTALETVVGKDAGTLLLPIKRELSNSRITAGGLEFLPVRWRIGQKVYEPQKIRVYLESMWKRIRPLEKNKALVLKPGLYDRIFDAASKITVALRRIRKQVDENQDSLETAVIIFDTLHVLAISFFELYFDSMFSKTGRVIRRKTAF